MFAECFAQLHHGRITTRAQAFGRVLTVELVGEVAPPVELRRCLALEREDRPRDANAVAKAVAAHLPYENIIPPRMHPKRRETLHEAIRAARTVPPAQFPPLIRHHSQRPTKEEFRRFREIEKHRDKHAHDLGLDPTLIASKSMIGDLARDWEHTSAGLMNWQRQLLQP